jgi:hypothetical protein
MRHVGDSSRHLHAGRTAPDYHEGRERVPLGGINIELGTLEGEPAGGKKESARLKGASRSGP